MDRGLAAESNARVSEPSRVKPIKRLTTNQRVSACMGAYICDANGVQSKKRERIFRSIVRAVGDKKFLVKFVNKATALEVFSNVLKVESAAASHPPDMPIPAPANPREAVVLVDLEEALDAQDEDEHLPPFPPEHEEVEASRNEEADREDEGEEMTNQDSQGNSQGKMPGQLLRMTEGQALSNYDIIRGQAEAKIAALIGKTVLVKEKSSASIQWKVISNHLPEDPMPEKLENRKYGIKELDVSNYKNSEILPECF